MEIIITYEEVSNIIKTKSNVNATFTMIASLAGVLLYVLSPIDLMADFIPLLGYVDDAAILGLAIKLAAADIEKYREWKKTIDVEEIK